jgi:hypothetical protein
MAYGDAREQAAAHTPALAFRTIADRLDHGEASPSSARA